MIFIKECTNEDDINHQIKRQAEEGFKLMSVQKVIEPIGHVWLRYIANPHSNYTEVKFTKSYYCCVFTKE